MSKIQVVADLRFKKEHLEEVLSLLKKMVTETKKETGCISYELVQDFNDNTVFFTIEEWESQEDLDRHLNSEGIRNLMKSAAPFFLAEPAIHQCYKLA